MELHPNYTKKKKKNTLKLRKIKGTKRRRRDRIYWIVMETDPPPPLSSNRHKLWRRGSSQILSLGICRRLLSTCRKWSGGGYGIVSLD